MEKRTGVVKVTEIINKAWVLLAPFAYNRFLARGRGGVFVRIAEMTFTPADGRIDAPARYVTAGDASLPPGAAKEFAAYDPEREVVFLFDDGHGGVHTYRGAASDQPSPKQLAEQAGTE